MVNGLFPAPIVPFIRQSDFAVRKPWNIPERRLLDYLLIYIQEGHCLIHVEGVDYHCQAGDFCLIQPRDLHTLQGKTDTITPYAHLDIFYNPRREESFPSRPGQVDLSLVRHLIQPRLNDVHGIFVPVTFQPSQPVRFRDLMLKMIATWQHTDPLSQLEAQHIATEVILLLLKDYYASKHVVAQVPQSLSWIASYLSFHMSESLSVADMAKRAQLSPTHFSVVFRRHFGVSPHRYLLLMRVRHAEELLKSTDLSLLHIAEYTGFSDVHHFSKAFKKITGIAPGAFRKGAMSQAAGT
jgi:AraC-like DNA-binding protein